MKEYLKMEDYVDGSVSVSLNHRGDVVIDYNYANPNMIIRNTMNAIEHAINSHDELVAEVGWLRDHLRACATELAKMIDAHNEQNMDDGSWKYDHQTPFEAIRYLGEIRD